MIGATLSLTGSLGALGRPLEAGYQQEIADVNAAGGIAIGGTKEKLKLVVLDNGSDPSTASSQAAELVQHDHAVALLGSATPQIVMPTAVAAEQLRVPFVTSQMPVEAFASGDKTGWTYSWDLFYDEQQQATDAAKALAAAPGDKKVALFTDNEPDSVVERPLYEAAFKADGLDVVGDYTFPVGTTDFSSFIADAKANGAQLVAGQLAPADGAALLEAADVVRVPPEGGLPGRDVGRRLPAALARPPRPGHAVGRLLEPRPGLARTARHHHPHARQEVLRQPGLRPGRGRLRGGRGADRRARGGRQHQPRQAQHRDCAHRRADHRRTGHVQPAHAHGDHCVPRHQVSPASGGGTTRPFGMKVFFLSNGPWFHVSSTRGTAASRARRFSRNASLPSAASSVM